MTHSFMVLRVGRGFQIRRESSRVVCLMWMGMMCDGKIESLWNMNFATHPNGFDGYGLDSMNHVRDIIFYVHIILIAFALIRDAVLKNEGGGGRREVEQS